MEAIFFGDNIHAFRDTTLRSGLDNEVRSSFFATHPTILLFLLCVCRVHSVSTFSIFLRMQNGGRRR